MPCVKLSLFVPQQEMRLVEETLIGHDAQSLTVSSAENETHLEHILHESPKWSRVRIDALFTLNEDIHVVLASLRSLGMEVSDVSFIGDELWQKARAPQLKPLDFGGLRVVSREEPTQVTKAEVRLDPGLAFGTGEHPTTHMCLAWLANHPPKQLSVLDFGTGSGILGIAAKKLGAGLVDAVDSDSLARETARENALYNNAEILVSERITAGKSYDLIVANILLNTILQFAPVLTACLKPCGVILLTGLLPGQLDRVQTEYSEIAFENTVELEDWRLLVGKKTNRREH